MSEDLVNDIKNAVSVINCFNNFVSKTNGLLATIS